MYVFFPLAIIVATLCYFGFGRGVGSRCFAARGWRDRQVDGAVDDERRESDAGLRYRSAADDGAGTVFVVADQVTGPATVARGIQVAVVLWFCTVFATFATEYRFEGRGVKILAITSGYCLVGMVLMVRCWVVAAEDGLKQFRFIAKVHCKRSVWATDVTWR